MPLKVRRYSTQYNPPPPPPSPPLPHHGNLVGPLSMQQRGPRGRTFDDSRSSKLKQEYELRPVHFTSRKPILGREGLPARSTNLVRKGTRSTKITKIRCPAPPPTSTSAGVKAPTSEEEGLDAELTGLLCRLRGRLGRPGSSRLPATLRPACASHAQDANRPSTRSGCVTAVRSSGTVRSVVQNRVFRTSVPATAASVLASRMTGNEDRAPLIPALTSTMDPIRRREIQPKEGKAGSGG